MGEDWFWIVGSLVIKLAAPRWWSVNTPAEETMRKGRPRKKPNRYPMNISLIIKKKRAMLKLGGVVVVKINFGRTIAIKAIDIIIFTGFGRIRAPKNGVSATMGAMRPIARKHKESMEVGESHALEAFTKRVR